LASSHLKKGLNFNQLAAKKPAPDNYGKFRFNS
jgi:hypothetical protein